MKRIYIIFTAALALLFLLYPETVSSSVKNALSFSAEKVLPTLFGFMVLSKLIISFDGARYVYPLIRPLASLLRLDRDECTAFIAGNLCGFPSGAYAAGEVTKRRNYSEMRKTTLFALSNNVSPGFAISFAGGSILGSAEAGIILYLSQLASSVIIACIMRRRIRTERSVCADTPNDVNFSEVFCNAVIDSSRACVCLVGFIATFSVISSLASTFAEKYGASDVAISYIRSLLEISGGCISAFRLDYTNRVALVAFSCGFSGLSVIFQSAAYLIKSGVRIYKYVILKFAQGTVCSVFSVAAIKLIMKT